jgi:hypothetical protein
MANGKKKIFVIGSGRSGTHLAGYLLGSHEEIVATIEEPKIYKAVAAMAIDPRLEEEVFPRVVDLYGEAHAEEPEKHYADKSHPNIWLAEKLADTFDDAVFIGMQRKAHPTVASMLRHGGVGKWHLKWRSFPIPNRFLGITEELADGYDELSMEEKFAIRWKAHAEEMARLRSSLGEDRLRVVEYERLVGDQAAVASELQEFLGLSQPFPPYEMRADSLDKWRDQLSAEQIAAIDAVIGPEGASGPSSSATA